MNLVNPDVYDSTIKAHRPMVPGTEALNPLMVPLSARASNQLLNLGDGLYVGNQLGSSIYYINGTTGVDSTTTGQRATPLKTLDYALALLSTASLNGQYSASGITIALAAGQTFPMTADFNIYGGDISFSFYGDTQYGDFNSAFVGTGAYPAVMADLVRPVIAPVSSSLNGQWHLAGINRFGGDVGLRGVQVSLPAAPATPSILLYSQHIDFVRSPGLCKPGYVILTGSIVAMTDINSYWGFLGILSRGTSTTFDQFASQFWINGRALSVSASPTPTSAELAARQYFVKLFNDLPGNVQNIDGYLSSTSANSSPGSGLVNLSWTDTEQLTVATGKTNLPTFPVLTDFNYGFRNYVFGLQRDQQSRPLNIVSSRLF